jgi:hypothetical protein
VSVKVPPSGAARPTSHRHPLGEDGDSTLRHLLKVQHRCTLGAPAVRAHPEEVAGLVGPPRCLQHPPVGTHTSPAQVCLATQLPHSWPYLLVGPWLILHTHTCSPHSPCLSPRLPGSHPLTHQSQGPQLPIDHSYFSHSYLSPKLSPVSLGPHLTIHPHLSLQRPHLSPHVCPRPRTTPVQACPLRLMPACHHVTPYIYIYIPIVTLNTFTHTHTQFSLTLTLTYTHIHTDTQTHTHTHTHTPLPLHMVPHHNILSIHALPCQNPGPSRAAPISASCGRQSCPT